MPLDGLTAGISTKLSFVDANGQQIFTGIESFNKKENAPTEEFVQVNGDVSHPQFHRGWSGTFVMGRFDNFFDNYTAAKEANYYSGNDQNELTITETISESNGTISQYQYLKCVVTMEDGGTYSGVDFVKQSASFVASRRKRIA